MNKIVGNIKIDLKGFDFKKLESQISEAMMKAMRYECERMLSVYGRKKRAREHRYLERFLGEWDG